MCDARANLLGVEMKCTAVMIVIETLMRKSSKMAMALSCASDDALVPRRSTS